MSENTNDNSNPLKNSKGAKKKRKIAPKGKMTTNSNSDMSDSERESKDFDVATAQEINASDYMQDIEGQGMEKEETIKKSVDKTDGEELQCDKESVANTSQKLTDSNCASLIESQNVKAPCTAQETIEDDTNESTRTKDSTDSDVEIIEVLQRGTPGSLRSSVIKIPSADISMQSANILKSEHTNARALDCSQGAAKKPQEMNNSKVLESGANSTLEDKTQEVKSSKEQEKGINNSSHAKASEIKLLKRLQINEYTNFMKNFDPQRSQREARKLENNIPYSGRRDKKKKQQNDKRLYDENGIYIETGQDLCDCLIEDCPGCHFPCSRCRSCKCGHACRRNRTWCYDEIEIEGTGEIIRRKV